MPDNLDTVLKESYDVVIAGGGPAGSTAAFELASAGIKTLLVERKGDVGKPVRCAEGVPRGRFEALMGGPPRPEWVSAVVNGGMGHSPADINVRRDYARCGYILEREAFDRGLFERATAAGATPLLRTEVRWLECVNGGARVELAREDGREATVACRVVVGADGVESVIGRAAGLTTAIPAEDVDTCAEYVLAGADEVYPDYIHFFLGHNYAPGGYAWCFPKSGGRHNVGLGITPTMAAGKTPFEYLDAFVAARYPNAVIEEVRGGVVPVGKPLPKLVNGCVALAGDAGRQTDPFSGEGICQALAAGTRAARAIVRGLKEHKLPAALAAYEAEWIAEFNDRYKQHYKVRRVILAMSDREMDDTIRILRDRMDISAITGSEIFPTFLKALWKNPQLIFKLRHLLD